MIAEYGTVRNPTFEASMTTTLPLWNTEIRLVTIDDTVRWVARFWSNARRIHAAVSNRCTWPAWPFLPGLRSIISEQWKLMNRTVISIACRYVSWIPWSESLKWRGFNARWRTSLNNAGEIHCCASSILLALGLSWENNKNDNNSDFGQYGLRL